MSEDALYKNWLTARNDAWEALCRHCGACCGAKEDPCEHLVIYPNGNSCCVVYDKRFEISHKSVSGKPVRCVSIRQKFGLSWPGDEACPYKKKVT